MPRRAGGDPGQKPWEAIWFWVLVLDLGYIQQCSGIVTVSVLSDHFWWGMGDPMQYMGLNTE